jgi:hypothetical protein
MAVIFGDKQKDGWIKVSAIQYQMESHPNGYTIKAEKIPPYPQHEPGVGWVQMFNPKTKRFRFDEIKISLTKEEATLEVAAAIRELATTVREVFGERTIKNMQSTKKEKKHA